MDISGRSISGEEDVSVFFASLQYDPRVLWITFYLSWRVLKQSSPLLYRQELSLLHSEDLLKTCH